MTTATTEGSTTTTTTGTTSSGTDDKTTLLGGGTDTTSGGDATGTDAGTKSGTDQGTTDDKSKTADDKSKTADDKPKADDKSKKGGAPDQYQDFALPEGAQVDQEAMTGFKELAKSHNLTQDQAQSLVDAHVKAVDKLLAGQRSFWEQKQTEWANEVLGNKEYQDSQGKTDAAIAVAKKGVLAVGGTKLQQALVELGVSNHPVIFAAFHKIGKAASEDEFIFGGGTTDAKSVAQTFYDKSNMK